jgi:hypothetical protein
MPNADPSRSAESTGGQVDNQTNPRPTAPNVTGGSSSGLAPSIDNAPGAASATSEAGWRPI